MKEHNNTDKTRAEIEALPIAGRIRNNWRGRYIVLYESPDPGKLYMVGVAYDGSAVVISHEEIGRNEAVAMDYWRHGQKTLTRD